MRRWMVTLGSVKLTLWLALVIAGLLFLGAHHTGREFDLFAALNETRLQTWLLANTGTHLGSLWWIFALTVAAVLVAINAICCLILRVESLFTARLDLPFRRLLHLLTPSAIHLLFCVLLLGHLITFTTGSWQRVQAVPGATIPISNDASAYTVNTVDEQYFEDGLLKGGLAQTTVFLRDDAGKTVTVSHLAPATIEGHTVILTMTPKRNNKMRVVPREYKTCDKPEEPIPDPVANKLIPNLELLVVSDSGLAIILVAWFAAVVLMVSYFWVRYKSEVVYPAVTRKPSQRVAPRSG